MAGEAQQGMDREEELRFLTRSAKQNTEAVAKGVEAFNEAARQHQKTTAILEDLAATAVARVQQGAQEAMKQAARADVAPQIEAAVKPMLTAIDGAIRQMRSVVADAERAAASIGRQKLIWKEMALVFLFGVCFGAVLVWFFVRADIHAALQQAPEPVTIQQQPPARTQPKMHSQKPKPERQEVPPQVQQ